MDELHRRTGSSASDWERLDLSHEVDLAAERPIDDRPVRSKASPTVIALSVVAVSLVTAFTVDGVRSWRRSQRAGSAVATGERAAISTSATVETSTSEPAVPPPAPQAVVDPAARAQRVVARDGSGRARGRGSSLRPRPPRAGGLADLPRLTEDVPVATAADDASEPVTVAEDEGDATHEPDDRAFVSATDELSSVPD